MKIKIYKKQSQTYPTFHIQFKSPVGKCMENTPLVMEFTIVFITFEYPGYTLGKGIPWELKTYGIFCRIFLEFAIINANTQDNTGLP